MTALGEYLREAGSKRRVPCVHDCCTFISDWAILLGFPDPMAAWRGAYDTDEGAEALIANAGGLTALVGPAFEGVGWRRVNEPDAGDIGIVGVGAFQASAIYSGQRWMMVADRGIVGVTFAPKRVVACWTARGA